MTREPGHATFAPTFFSAEPDSAAMEVGADPAPQFTVEVSYATDRSAVQRVVDEIQGRIQEDWEYDRPRILPEVSVAHRDDERALITLRWRGLGSGRPALAWELVRLNLELYYSELLDVRKPVRIAVQPEASA